MDDRAALNGILFVLKTRDSVGGFGSGITCWRRLRDWQASGVWERLHLAMLTRLREHDQIDWSRASIRWRSSGQPPGGQQTEMTHYWMVPKEWIVESIGDVAKRGVKPTYPREGWRSYSG